jgi:hypothetical protein
MTDLGTPPSFLAWKSAIPATEPLPWDRAATLLASFDASAFPTPMGLPHQWITAFGSM